MCMGVHVHDWCVERQQNMTMYHNIMSTSVYKTPTTRHHEHTTPNTKKTPKTNTGGQDVALPVTMNEMLLRGCVLANSKQVAGLVVYTGKETRIQKNSAKTPLKVGMFIGVCIGVRVGVCIGWGVE